MSEFTTRLRELDHQVEQLRAALAHLQKQLATNQPSGRAAWVWDRREPDDYLRAYT